MPLFATSLKLPDNLKARLAHLAALAGESPHAFMVRALSEHADAGELSAAFVEDAKRADHEMERSGVGLEMKAVHRYLRDRVRGKATRRPPAVRWRK